MIERPNIRLADLVGSIPKCGHDELDWWRNWFALRFQPGNLPKVGSPLGASRFVLMVENKDGELERYGV